jgi:hypothetical protein
LHGHLEQEHGVDDVVGAQTLQAFVERPGVSAQWILFVELVGFVCVEDFLELFQPRVVRVRALKKNNY